MSEASNSSHVSGPVKASTVSVRGHRNAILGAKAMFSEQPHSQDKAHIRKPTKASNKRSSQEKCTALKQSVSKIPLLIEARTGYVNFLRDQDRHDEARDQESIIDVDLKKYMAYAGHEVAELEA